MKRSFFALTSLALASTVVHAQSELPQQNNDWFTGAQEALQRRLSLEPNTATAKNIILLVADGNGVGSNYATRLYHGQQNGNYGDENVLPQEAFPYLALSKTYNTNAQTPDSAGTAAAMQSGIKTKAGLLGVDETVNRGDCSGVEAGTVSSIGDLLSDAGKSVGVVSTARLTHATPAAGYAHSADRNFEDDSELPEGCEVPDIADQLLEAMKAGVVDLALGGGRRHFLPEDAMGEEDDSGRRTDGRNLIEEAQAAGARYVWNDETFGELDLEAEGPILGLFESSHMQYEHDRAGEPSLAEMVESSVSALSTNDAGFYLVVEAGRVDHANHDGNLHRMVTDGVAFAEAVAKAAELTDPAETLIIVTADHEHAIAFGGYCGRGTPITGLCMGIDNEGEMHTGEPQLGLDNKPYTVAGYLNGAGATVKEQPLPDGMTVADLESFGVTEFTLPTEEGEEPAEEPGNTVWVGARPEITQEEATDPDYLQQANIPLNSETHSGEDVAIYAQGPWAHLFDGTVEQNYIFHVMHHAAFGSGE